MALTISTYQSTDPGDVAESLEEIEQASLRAGQLARQLLTFSKGGAPLKKIINMGDVVRSSATFALRGSNTAKSFSIAPDLWPVSADEGQISQVVGNLVINADQAMLNGGTVEMVCENISIGKPNMLPMETGDYTKVSIRDNGIGISDEHLQKIFDPYFTTKQRGSGLGLATAYSIIKRHGGYISVDSQLGVGTTFQFCLPAVLDNAVEKKEKKHREAIVGAGRILVMDDDKAVRTILRTMLIKLGYEVELVAHGAEAVECYEDGLSEGEPFDAVILDLTIPGGLGGKETIQKLKEIDPYVKAIVSSGYSTDPIMADYGDYGFSDVIPKPYRLRELSETISAVLGSQSQSG